MSKFGSPRHLIDVAESARRLGLSEGYVRHLIQRGEMPGVVRPGGRAVRIDPEVLECFIDSRRALSPNGSKTGVLNQ